MDSFISRLRRVVQPEGRGELADVQLLERFICSRDEAAFEVLVWRYGLLVLNVCRRLLREEHEVEDAFQATFLVLVRKAGSIGKREALAGWLYRVAYRIALAARAGGARRGFHEKQCHDGPEAVGGAGRIGHVQSVAVQVGQQLRHALGIGGDHRPKLISEQGDRLARGCY